MRIHVPLICAGLAAFLAAPGCRPRKSPDTGKPSSAAIQVQMAQAGQPIPGAPQTARAANPAPASPASPSPSPSPAPAATTTSAPAPAVQPLFAAGAALFPRTPSAIRDALARIASEPIAQPARPALHPWPFEPDRWDRQIAALRRLNAQRYLAGLASDVRPSYAQAAEAEAGARLLAQVGQLTHSPTRPAGISDTFWLYGQRGLAASNLFEGSGDHVFAVDAFMDDSDPYNVRDLIHRRWLLNPAMGSAGLGDEGRYLALYAHDQTRIIAPSPEPVAYPAAGYFPLEFLKPDAAWSVMLSSRFFRVIDPAAVTVEVRPLDAHLNPGSPVALRDVRLSDIPAFELRYAVIFRPAVQRRVGQRYGVKIAGLRDAAGRAMTIEYLVEFI